MDLRVLTLHDQRVTYRTAGEGPVLLLIHGMAGSATTWKYVMPSLSKPAGQGLSDTLVVFYEQNVCHARPTYRSVSSMSSCSGPFDKGLSVA